MSNPTTKSKQVDIYPFNVKKADALAEALRMSYPEMVNFLIEVVTVEQLTQVRLQDPVTKRTVTFTRRTSSDLSGYKP